MLKNIKEKYNQIPVAMKASFWFVICSVLKDVIDILVMPVFTRILTTEQYGIYNVYQSWFQIFKIIFTLFLFSDVFNVGLLRFEEERDQFISATLGFTTTVTGFFFVLYLLNHSFWEQVLDLPGFMIWWMFAQVVTHVAYHCWIRRERFDYHYKNVSAVSFLYVFLQPTLGILAICCLDLPINPGYTRIIAAVAVHVLIGMILYIGMMRRGKIFYHRKFWIYSLKTGIVLIPFNLSKVVLNQSDRIMLNTFLGKAETAVYSVAHSGAFMLQAMMEGINGAFVPWFYRKLKKEDYAGIVPVVNVMVLVASAGVISISLIAPEFMKILASEDYYMGVYCIPALSYSVYLIFIYSLFSDIELFYGKNNYVTIVAAVGSVVNIILNAFFIPRYGFIAASYTTLAGYAIMCFGNYWFVRKCLKDVEVDERSIYSLKLILLNSSVLFIFSMVCVVLYERVIVRWGLFALCALTVVISRNKWLEIYREVKKNR
ncbi:MAG: oligosaccharide flippase family protein [Lachnospiraceae bacterium]|nr:oligosaccharide flippase family protein [Lachnospiraceae bacterium]